MSRVKAEIANWRWAGVPFYLRTGKRLAARVSELVIEFKPIPHSIFPESAGNVLANQLVIRLQPDEGVKQYIMIKDPGPGGMRLRQIPLDMSFAQSFDGRAPDAYERLIMDVVRGNQTLFMRRDEVEAAWKWIDPILNAWSDSRQEAQGYTAGTWGPSAVDRADRTRRANMARERVTAAAVDAVWHRFGTRGELAEALANDVAGRLASAVERKGAGFLAVSGGTTPAAFLRALSTKPIDWDKVTVALVDERFVPETSPRSNAAFVRSTLLQDRAAEAHFVGLYRPAESAEVAAAEASGSWRSSPGRSTWRSSAWERTGIPPRSFPTRRELATLLSPSTAAYVLPVHADSAGEPRLTLPLARIVAAATIAVHIEGAEKKAVLEAALEPGARHPIGAVFRHAGKPVQIYWAP